MASTKTNKIKKQTPLLMTKFLDIKLCCLVQKDSTALKLLKSHFASTEHGSVSLLYSKCVMFSSQKMMNYQLIL